MFLVFFIQSFIPFDIQFTFLDKARKCPFSFQARKKLVAIFQTILYERKERRNQNEPTEKKDMMDILLEVEDENGRELNDEEISDVLVMYVNAGHESSGQITMWATVFLQENPQIFKKAKVAKISHFRKLVNSYVQVRYFSRTCFVLK